MKEKFTVHYRTSSGRVVITDSLSYFGETIGAQDVLVGASFAGIPTVALALANGVKAVIAHDAGIGKDEAGIRGLWLAQQFAVPAAAIEGQSARLSDGASLLKGRISHANAAAQRLGVLSGQSVEMAARLLVSAAPGHKIDASHYVDNQIHKLEENTRGGIYAVWSLSLVQGTRPHDVFCAASHGGRVLGEYALKVKPKGVVVNDAGMGLDNSGIDGLRMIGDDGIAAAAVGTMSARIGDALNTWDDGVISAVNHIAERKGVRVGQSAKIAARLMLA